MVSVAFMVVSAVVAEVVVVSLFTSNAPPHILHLKTAIVFSP